MACLVVSVDEAGDSDGLLGEALGHDLVGALGLLADAVAGEDGVAHAHQDVVHAVQLHELHAAPPHVRQDAVRAQRAVQTAVPVGGPAAAAAKKGLILSKMGHDIGDDIKIAGTLWSLCLFERQGAQIGPVSKISSVPCEPFCVYI